MIFRATALGIMIVFFTNCSTWQKPMDRQVSGAEKCEVNPKYPPMFSVVENSKERVVVELGDFAEKYKLHSGFKYTVSFRGSKEDKENKNLAEAVETQILEGRSRERLTRVELTVLRTGVFVFRIFDAEKKAVWKQKVFVVSAEENTLTDMQKQELAERFAPVLSMHDQEVYFPVSLEYMTNQQETDPKLADEIFILAKRREATTKSSVPLLNKIGLFNKAVNAVADYIDPDEIARFPFSEINNILPFYGDSDSVLKSGLKSSSDSALKKRYGANHKTVYFSVFENLKWKEIYVNYHFFYSYDSKSGMGDKNALTAHIFDRESMTVVLNRSYQPKYVFFGAHLPTQIMAELGPNGYPKKGMIQDQVTGEEKEGYINHWKSGRVLVNWKDVVKNGGRPVPAIALGSHGVYPRPGNYGIYINDFQPKSLPTKEPAGGSRLLYPEFAQVIEKTSTSYSYKLRDLALDQVTSNCGKANRLLAFSGSTVDVLGPSNATFPPYTDREEDYKTYGDANAPVFDMNQ